MSKCMTGNAKLLRRLEVRIYQTPSPKSSPLKGEEKIYPLSPGGRGQG
jgi:hypothetical protein